MMWIDHLGIFIEKKIKFLKKIGTYDWKLTFAIDLNDEPYEGKPFFKQSKILIHTEGT